MNNETNSKMEQVLNLKKDEKGCYSITADGISITVYNTKRYDENYGKNWTLLIGGENKVYLTFYGKTKKECVEVGTKWVIKNL